MRRDGRAPTRRSGGGVRSSGSSKQRTLNEYYATLFGPRWPALREAMRAEPKKIALWNRFCQLPFDEVMDGLVRVNANSTLQAFRPVVACEVSDASAADGVASRGARGDIAPPVLDAHNIKSYYLMDYASALVVEALDVGPFDTVLDLCAAPGGKSVAICQFLSPNGELTANEVRAERCARLERNLREHIPVNYVPWRVVRRDGQTWHDPNAYSRVLVDAPCSSERHLMQQYGSAAAVPPRDWTEASSARLSDVQCALLQRACETCALHGRVVYSTCSLSPLENDAVVERALRAGRCRMETCALSQLGASAAGGPGLGTATRYGRLILPDADEGWGPMYICALQKTALLHDESDSSDDDDDE